MTRVYEKTLFVPFDTTQEQTFGMETWGGSYSVQVRGYVQLIDDDIKSLDVAITYLERGQEPLLLQNFDRKGVPKDIAQEFLRVRRIWGKELQPAIIGMFKEQRASFECYREAFGASTEAIANGHMADAKAHEQKSKAYEATMIAALRAQL